MDSSSSQNVARLKFQKRPDSLKLELLTIPEGSVRNSFGPSVSLANQVNIGFKNIAYHVREGIFDRRRRKILHDIHGDFYSGDLTAIMGPSGSGKSTLMSILAGYTTKAVTGELLINEENRDEPVFRRQSCYIMQTDNLQLLLTAHEAMMIAANLKLSTRTSLKDKKARIKEILESIGLWECREVRTNSLSGGQRKRLSIALELLKNPQVLFFDEPTSGLDSSSSKQCLMLLKQLAQDGRTVVCTIHQPSAMLFEMFDHLYTLAEGQCIYQGSIKGMLPYLEDEGLQCPPYHNPADYLMEVAVGDHGSFNDRLVNKCKNGDSPDWRRRQRDSLQMRSFDHIEKMMKSGLVTPVKAPSIFFPVIRDPDRTIKRCCDNNYPTSFFHQLTVLIRRTFLILSRDRTLTYSRILTHLAIAIIIGVLYLGIGKDAKDVNNNANFLFFSVMFLMLTAFNCVTTTFPSEVPIIAKEHFNRWYSVKSYYLALTLADIPVQMTATIAYALITFFMTAQPLEAFRLTFYIVTCILISLVSQSFGLFIGSTMDIKNGVIFGPFCFLPFTIFSGFFVQLNDCHPYLRWVFHISFLKYGFEGLMLPIFGYNRGKLHCSQDYCHYVYPDKFLDQMDMENAVYAHCVYFLVSLIIIIRIVAYCALRIQVKRRR